MKTLTRSLPLAALGYGIGVVIEIVRHIQPSSQITQGLITDSLKSWIPIALGVALFLFGLMRRE